MLKNLGWIIKDFFWNLDLQTFGLRCPNYGRYIADGYYVEAPLHFTGLDDEYNYDFITVDEALDYSIIDNNL